MDPMLITGGQGAAGSNPVSPIGRERFGDNNPLSTPLVKGATIHLTFKIGFIEN